MLISSTVRVGFGEIRSIARLALVLLVVACSSQNVRTTANQPAPPSTCVPKGIDVQHPHTLHFKPGELRPIEKNYQSGPAHVIRESFDAYRKTGVDTSGLHSLKKLDRATLSDRFLLLSDVPGLYGGDWILLRFERHREAVYNTWVLHHKLVSVDRIACTPAQLHWLDVTFGDAEKLVGNG